MLVFLLLSTWGPAASATLLGDSVDVLYIHGDITSLLEQDTVVVGAGAEVTCSGIGVGTSTLCNVDFGGHHLASLDLGADTISILWGTRGAFFDPPGGFNGFLFSGLGLAGGLGAVSMTCNDLSGVACNPVLSFGNAHPQYGNFISVNFAGCMPLGDTPGAGGANGPSCNPTDVLLVINPVPEPAVIALLGIGGLMLIGPGRRVGRRLLR